MVQVPMPESTRLDAELNRAWNEGIKNGEVVYSKSTSLFLRDGAIPFDVRYLPSLDKKPTSRSPSPEAEEEEEEEEECKAMKNDKTSSRKQSRGAVDPFAAPRDNVVLEMSEYTCVLNKYALEPTHFLVVTNAFYPQRGPLRRADLEMMYRMLAASPTRYCFFNGGLLAGASQEHRHFQFLHIPHYEGSKCWPDQIYDDAIMNAPTLTPTRTDIHSHPDIHAHHFLLPILDSSSDSLDASFRQLYEAAKSAIQWTRQSHKEEEEEEMAYNFLMTHRYMLLFPRRNEEWDEHEIGVGGTCLVGSIMVTKQVDLEHVRRVGIKRILTYVGYPKS